MSKGMNIRPARSSSMQRKSGNEGPGSSDHGIRAAASVNVARLSLSRRLSLRSLSRKSTTDDGSKAALSRAMGKSPKHATKTKNSKMSMQDADNDASLGNPFGVTMPEEKHLLLNAPDGTTRKVIHWLPTDASVEPSGTVVFLHGYGGNARRWQHACKWHTDQGMQVYSMDMAFHGDNETNSTPFKGHNNLLNLRDFDVFVDDACALLELVESLHPDLPYVVQGHSMGGLVWVHALLRVQDTWKGKGMVLMGPGLRLLGQGISPNTLLPYTRWFSAFTDIIDTVTFGKFPNPAASAESTTENEAVRLDILRNPKMFGTMLCVRFWNIFRNATNSAMERMEQLTVPFLVMHGDKDTIASVQGSEKLVEVAASADKTLVVVEGGYHEIMNSADQQMRDHVRDTVNDWIHQHLTPTETEALPKADVAA